MVGPAGGTGEVFDWTVPTQPSDRYAGYTHAQAVAAIDSPDPLPNGLRFGVALTATDDGGQEHASELVIVEQDIKDAIRQEYADFQRLELPERDSLGVFHTDHFTASELNHGDYGVFLATERMRIGLETVRTKLNELFFVDDEGLILTSGYRNPVHHILHAGATAPESEHQYGVAVDVALGGHTGRTPEEFFEDLRLAAQAVDVGVCWEPEQTIRDSAGGELNHAHLDWRAECPDDWGLN